MNKALLNEIIIESIDWEYVQDCQPELFSQNKWEALQAVIQVEKGSYSPESIQYWLMGLPSACTIPFENCDIEQLYRTAGVITDKTRQHKIDDLVLDQYWPNMAMRLCMMINKEVK